MKPLTTENLNIVLKENPVTKRAFLGTFPGCVLPLTKLKQYSFITNTELHHESGEHWNAWFVYGNKVIFFDSFGRDPRDTSFPELYRDILKNFKVFEFSKTQIQDFTSFTCGYFCIHFIYILSLGLDVDFFVKEYSSDCIKNDDVVIKFVNMLC